MSGLEVEAEIRFAALRIAPDFAVAPGERVALVGPNGSGKSTILRAIAGLTPLSTGRVALDGRVLDDGRVFVAPERRQVALAFADRRLFPHLTVRDNVAFAQRARLGSRTAAQWKARDWLERLDLLELADRKPHQLSSGQSQRVALARALAQEPRALLLDEPTAALDAHTRDVVRAELHRHLADVEVPTIIVTHDPLEAMLLADRVVVLEDGEVVQIATPELVANRPATPYVARFLGLNLYSGTMADGLVRLEGGGTLIAAEAPASGRVLVSLRPSAITLHSQQPDPASARNHWPGRVVAVEMLGDRVRVQVAGAPDARVDVTPAAVAELGLAQGREVWMSAKATETVAYPSPTLGE